MFFFVQVVLARLGVEPVGELPCLRLQRRRQGVQGHRQRHHLFEFCWMSAWHLSRKTKDRLLSTAFEAGLWPDMKALHFKIPGNMKAYCGGMTRCSILIWLK